MNIGVLMVSLGVDTTGLLAGQAAMLKFEKTTTASINMMAQRMRTFGYLSSMTLTLPLIMAGKSAIKMASDFEFSMQKIVGLAGVAQSTVNEWSKALLKMGPELAQTPQALAEALYFITSSGIKSTEALNVLEIAAKGATAGLGETADVAKLLVFAMNAYKASNLTAAKTADMLTVAVREGAIEAEGFAGAVQSVIPIASAVGVSLGQVLGTMAAMSLQGASAANAAVYLKGILNSIMKIKPSNEAGKALAELGSSGLALRKVLGSGPNGLMDVLLKIQEWSKTNPYLLNKVFGNIRALTGGLSLVGDNLKDNQKVISDVVNAYGDLGKASDAVANTIKKRMDMMSASTKAAWTKFGEAIFVVLEPVLKWLVKALNNVIKAFDSLSQPMKTTIVIIGMLAAAAGPVALLTSLFMYMTPAILALGKAFIWLETAVLGINVWVALAAVIGGVGLAIYRHNKAATEMQKIQSGVNQQIGAEIFSLDGVFTKLKNATKGTDERSAAIKIINDRYAPYLKNLLTEKSSLEDIEQAQKDATNALIANISVKGYKEQLEKVMTSISKEFDRQFNTFIDAFSTSYGGDRVGEFISALFKGADDALKESGGKFEKGVLGYSQTAKNIWDEFIKPISQQTGFVKNSLGDFQKAFLSFLDIKSKKGSTVETLTAMISQFEKLFTGSNNLANGLDGVANGFDDITGSSDEIQKIWDDLQALLKYIDAKAVILKELGMAVDPDKEKLEAFTSALEAFLKLGLTPTHWMLKAVIDDLGKFNGLAETAAHQKFFKDMEEKLKASATPEISFAKGTAYVPDYSKLLKASKGAGDLAFMKDFQTELELITLKNKVFGDSFNTVSAQISFFKETLNQMWDAKMRPGKDPLMDAVIKQMYELIAAEKIQDIAVGVLQNSFTTLFDSMNIGFKDATTGFQKMVNGMLQDIMRLIAKLIALIIVYAILDVISGGGSAFAGAAKTLKGTGGMGDFIKKGFGFGGAQGGMVPPGYPNDSYPARLTSGEMVIPPGKLNQNIFNDSSQDKLVAVVTGDQLNFILTKRGRKINSYA